MKKNVGIVTSWFAGGAGYVSKSYEAALSQEHNVFIYARGIYAAGLKERKGDPEWDHANVTWGKKHYDPTGVWKHQFLKWILDNKLDVIIFNEQRFWPAVVWAKQQNIVCGAYIDYYTQATVSRFAIYDFLVCNTKRHFSAFDWHPHCYYIPWGVDLSRYHPVAHSNERPLTFITSEGWGAASNYDRRGGLRALQSFPMVKGKCKYLLYSQHPLERMTPQWKAAIAADKRIELRVGTFSPFPYNEGDVFVYPSRLDGIGLTLPEALACGLPAITTDNAPMNEFVMKNLNGVTIPVEKFISREDGYYWPEALVRIEDIAAALQKFVDDPTLVQTLRRNVIDDAQKRFDWFKNSRELCEIVRTVEYHDFSSMYKSLLNSVQDSPYMLFKKSIHHTVQCLLG